MRRLIRSATRAGAAVLVAAAMAMGGWAVPAQADDCQSLEDCYGYEEMGTFLGLAWGLVNDFIQDRFPSRLFLVRLQYVPHGESGTEGCDDESGPAEYTEMSYEYCAPDKTIYIGQDLLWKFYSEIGDAAAVMGLAHEYGHFLQDVQGVPPATTAAESIPRENQADCVAGAWFGYAESLGIVEYSDDLDDLKGLLDFIGSSESDENRDHGTTAERTDSVNLGIAGGIESCNAFFPETPIRSDTDLEYWRRAWAGLAEARRGSAAPSPAVWSATGEGESTGSRTALPMSRAVVNARGSIRPHRLGPPGHRLEPQ
jgi:hypothetical protein